MCSKHDGRAAVSPYGRQWTYRNSSGTLKLWTATRPECGQSSGPPCLLAHHIGAKVGPQDPATTYATVCNIWSLQRDYVRCLRETSLHRMLAFDGPPVTKHIPGDPPHIGTPQYLMIHCWSFFCACPPSPILWCPPPPYYPFVAPSSSSLTGVVSLPHVGFPRPYFVFLFYFIPGDGWHPCIAKGVCNWCSASLTWGKGITFSYRSIKACIHSRWPPQYHFCAKGRLCYPPNHPTLDYLVILLNGIPQRQDYCQGYPFFLLDWIHLLMIFPASDFPFYWVPWCAIF